MKIIIILIINILIFSSCHNNWSLVEENTNLNHSEFKKNNFKLNREKKDQLNLLNNLCQNNNNFNFILKKYIKEGLLNHDDNIYQYLELINIDKKDNEYKKEYIILKNISEWNCDLFKDKDILKYCNELKNTTSNLDSINKINNFTCDTKFKEDKQYVLWLLKSNKKCNFPNDFNVKWSIFYYFYTKDNEHYLHNLEKLFLKTICKK